MQNCKSWHLWPHAEIAPSEPNLKSLLIQFSSCFITRLSPVVSKSNGNMQQLRLLLLYYKRYYYKRYIKFNWLCHKEGHADPPPSSEMTPIKKWLQMVRNVLNRKETWIKKNFDFYFLSYHRILGWFFRKNDTKMVITRKIKS